MNQEVAEIFEKYKEKNFGEVGTILYKNIIQAKENSKKFQFFMCLPRKINLFEDK